MNKLSNNFQYVVIFSVTQYYKHFIPFIIIGVDEKVFALPCKLRSSPPSPKKCLLN